MAFILHDDQGNAWSVSVDSSTGALVATEVQTVTLTPPSPGDNPDCALQLQGVVNWARTQSKMIPIVGVGGFSNEPALSICNNVLQEMLAPPFNWKWNRVDAVPFLTADYTQDYLADATDVSNIGWLESAVCEYADDSQDNPNRYPLTVVRDLAITSDYGDPVKIAFKYNADFSISYRLWPKPTGANFKIYPVYQVKCPVKTALTQTWAPIPDQLGYVLRQGFLAMAFRHAKDQREIPEYQIFQAMIQKALGKSDAENTDSAFYPERPILLG